MPRGTGRCCCGELAACRGVPPKSSAAGYRVASGAAWVRPACPLLGKRFCSVRWDPNPGQSLWKRKGLCVAAICEDLTCQTDVLAVGCLVTRRRVGSACPLGVLPTGRAGVCGSTPGSFPSCLVPLASGRAAVLTRPWLCSPPSLRKWNTAAQSLVSQPVPTLVCNE